MKTFPRLEQKSINSFSVMAGPSKLFQLFPKLSSTFPLIVSSNLSLLVCDQRLSTPSLTGPGTGLPHIISPFSTYTPDIFSNLCHTNTTNSHNRSALHPPPRKPFSVFHTGFRMFTSCLGAEFAPVKPLSATPANMCCCGVNSSGHWSNLSLFAFVQSVSLASFSVASLFGFSSAAVSSSLPAPLWQC